MVLIQNCEAIEVFCTVFTPHVCKLEARANRKLCAAKSFGGVSDFNVLSNTQAKVSLLRILVMVYCLTVFYLCT